MVGHHACTYLHICSHQGQFSPAKPSTGMFWGGGRILENLKETHMGDTWKNKFGLFFDLSLLLHFSFFYTFLHPPLCSSDYSTPTHDLSEGGSCCLVQSKLLPHVLWVFHFITVPLSLFMPLSCRCVCYNYKQERPLSAQLYAFLTARCLISLTQ